jgi:hypothetical protein
VPTPSKVTYTRLLEDHELRAHLENRDVIVFKDLGRAWQDVEKQVERLSFGEDYVVSQRGAKPGDTRVSPLGNH